MITVSTLQNTVKFGVPPEYWWNVIWIKNPRCLEVHSDFQISSSSEKGSLRRQGYIFSKLGLFFYEVFEVLSPFKHTNPYSSFSKTRLSTSLKTSSKHVLKHSLYKTLSILTYNGLNDCFSYSVWRRLSVIVWSAQISVQISIYEKSYHSSAKSTRKASI